MNKQLCDFLWEKMPIEKLWTSFEKSESMDECFWRISSLERLMCSVFIIHRTSNQIESYHMISLYKTLSHKYFLPRLQVRWGRGLQVGRRLQERRGAREETRPALLLSRQAAQQVRARSAGWQAAGSRDLPRGRRAAVVQPAREQRGATVQQAGERGVL